MASQITAMDLFIFETFYAGPCHGGLNDDCWILASSCSQAVSQAPPATICSVWLIVGHSSGAPRANAVHGEPESVGSGRSTPLQHDKAKALLLHGKGFREERLGDKGAGGGDHYEGGGDGRCDGHVDHCHNQ